MVSLIHGLELLFAAIPPALLEIWGRLAYIVGLALALFAYGGFTFRPGGAWALGRIRQSWDTQALVCAGITVAVVPFAGWLGSNIVLVAGAQTLESLKDLMVFLCIVLFGYPALLAVPPAYMLSDLIEGVPPSFVLDWFWGYFCWTAFVWLAHQFIGRSPDFRRLRTWGGYALFVLALMSFDPVMWGFICSAKFTAPISYGEITPALAFTLLITWGLAPFAMLGALPLARRYGLFWAERPGFVVERRLGQSGRMTPAPSRGLPIRLVLAASFTGLMLVLVGTVAYLSLRSGKEAADLLATHLHEEVAENLNLRLDTYLEHEAGSPLSTRLAGVETTLMHSSVARPGRAFMLDRQGHVIASSLQPAASDPVLQAALADLKAGSGGLSKLGKPQTFRFDVVTAKPLARETWLAQITPYADNAGTFDWLVVTAMPESYYLASVQAGSSQTAMLLAIALTAVLALAGWLASLVAAPIHRIAQSAEAMARGELLQHVERSTLLELDTLVLTFNRMTAQVHSLFHRTRASEAKAKAVFEASPAALAVFDVRNTNYSALDRGRAPVLVEANSAWQRITGYAREESTGKSGPELALWRNTEDRHSLALLFLRDGFVENFEAQLLRANGRAFDALISLRDADVDGERLSVFAVEDITDRKEASARLLDLNRQLQTAQADLLHLNSQLDQRVRDRTQALEYSTTQLQSALDNLRQTQDQLVHSEKLASLGHIVARVAHELNTPLGVSVTAASSLQDGTRELQQRLSRGQITRAEFDSYLATMAEGLEMLHQALARTHGLVANFKRVAVDQSSGQRRQFELHAAIADVRALVATTLRKTPYQLEIHIAPGITMDSYPGAIEQVFINLVNNAVLHAFAGRDHGTMTLLATADAGQVRMVFGDDGRGMSAAVLEQIFNPFFTTATSKGGSGLGMTISFNLVTGTLGGSIEAVSTEGQGSLFTILMPRVAPHQTSEEA